MKLPPLLIGDLKAEIPIIQGGMGIGVSLSKLAGAVAKAGGIGVISAAQPGYDEPDFEKNPREANLRALEKHIRLAKEIGDGGVVGVNIMVAMNHYADMVSTCVKAGADIIISGAGLPTDLPKLVEGSDIKISPIVSSARAATVLLKVWDKRYKKTADMVVVEGPRAGGHLGFHPDELEEYQNIDLKQIVKDVIDAVKYFEEKYQKKIPVVVAGGIFNGKDIAEYMKIGASGVQMATRFVATEECDAHVNFKMAYVNAKEEDVKIIKSPVGMPGRAIQNKFLGSYNDQPISKCYACIRECNPAKTIYCISKALIEAVKGNVDEGLLFAGDNVHRINEITTVKKLMEELVAEAEGCDN